MPTNKQIRDCFIGARALINDGTKTFICPAVAAQAATHGIPTAVKCMVIINRGIDGTFSLGDWLAHEMNGADGRWADYEPMFKPSVLWMCRMAWLDKLIEDYSE